MWKVWIASLSALAIIGCSNGADTNTPPELVMPVLTDAQQSSLTAAKDSAGAIDAASDPDAKMAALDAWLAEASQHYPDNHPELLIIESEKVAPHFYKGELDAAETLMLRIIDGLEDYPDYSGTRGESLANLAVVYNQQGRHEDARPLFQERLQILIDAGDETPPEDLGVAYNNVAASDLEIGDLESALANNAKALAIADGLETPFAQSALWYANRPVYLQRAGRRDDAISAARRAAVHIDSVLPPGHPFGANNLSNLASLLLEAGRTEEAEPAAQEALTRVAAAQGRDSVQAGAMMVGLANVKLAQHELDAARLLYEEARAIFEAAGAAESNRARITRARLAMIDYMAGDLDAALDRQTHIVEEWRGDGMAVNPELDGAELDLLRFATDTDDIDLAKDTAARLDERFASARVDNDPSRLRLDASRALIALAEGDAEQAREALVSILQKLEADRRLDKLVRASTAGRQIDIQTALADVIQTAVGLNDPGLVWRSAALSGNDGASLAAEKRRLRDSLTGLDAETLRDIQDAAEGYDAQLAAFNADAAKGEASNEALQALDTARSELIQMANSLAIADADNDSLSDVQSSLDNGERLLGMVELEREIVGLFVTRDSVTIRRWNRQNMARLADRVRAEIDAGLMDADASYDDAAAAELAQMLFGETEGWLDGAERLYVRTGSTLDSVPLAVLPVNNAPLGLQTAIRVLPGVALPERDSIEALASPRYLGVSYSPSEQSEPVSSGSSGMLAFRGALDPEERFTPLPGASDEIAAIATSFGDRSTLIENAGEADFKATNLSDADIIVIAAHGLDASRSPLGEPALLLGQSESEDGWLGASEIAQLDLDSRLVVLSACNTAAAQTGRGRSYSGLARALLYAGSDAVIVSHWPVRDDAAAFLTTRTGEAMADGLPPDAALRQAMSDLRESNLPGASHPAIWAPFVVIGG